MSDAVKHRWPLGHFYSPVPDTVLLGSEPERSRVWTPVPREAPGLDWRDAEQVALVRDVFAAQPPIDFPRGGTDPHAYHSDNVMFSPLDAWALAAVLRHVRPQRMIEIGCGWSTLVTTQIARDSLGGALDLTCIEPYPPPQLDGLPGVSRLLVERVQDVPLDVFAALGDGDVLFIDTSHVVKTGSDVNHLFHEIVPRLAPGVVVHVHDILLPYEYPEPWVLDGWGWNEQYLVRSFLTFNDAFEILLGMCWMMHAHLDVLAATVPDWEYARGRGCGSLWFRRTS